MTLLTTPTSPCRDPRPMEPEDGDATSKYCEENLCMYVVWKVTVWPAALVIVTQIEVGTRKVV